MKKTIQIISFILLCFYVIAVGFLCLMEPDDMPAMPLELFGLPIDKVAHFTMFFPWPILTWFSFDHEGKSSRWKALVLVSILLIGAGMAISTELLQKMTDYRSFDMMDFYADMTGMGICWLMVTFSAFVETRKDKKRKECSEKQS